VALQAASQPSAQHTLQPRPVLLMVTLLMAQALAAASQPADRPITAAKL